MNSGALSKSMLIFLTLALAITTHIHTEEKELHAQFPLLAGLHNLKLLRICQQLKNIQEAQKKGAPLPQTYIKNRLLLHGAPGNGKTTLAHTVAETSHCNLISVSAPELLGVHVSDGVKNVKQLFEKARAYVNQYNQPTVIIVDEIDALAEHINKLDKSESKAVLQELWHQLDLIQNDPRIFFICMTNAEEIDGTLKSRFGNNIITRIQVRSATLDGIRKK